MNNMFVCPKIKIDNTPIEQVRKIKFLGVIINQFVDWKDHIYVIKQKVSKSLGIILRVRKSMPLTVLRSLYHTLMHPYFEYCNIIWAIDRNTVFDDLFVYQKKALRIITNSSWRSHTAPLFKNLNILPLCNINDLQVASFIYCCIHRLLPARFCAIFRTNASLHSHDTRQKEHLHIFSHRLNIRKKHCLHFWPCSLE